MTTPIKTYSLKDLIQIITDLKQPKFRARQIYEWIYLRHAKSYDEMTNIPRSLRDTLALLYPLYTPQIEDKQISVDGTRKYLLSYSDGILVETVAIPSKNNKRLTICFSTQAGCSMECSFCATGKEGFTRNLLPGEMVDQILIAQNDVGMRVTNAVGMGQGEPFLNYDNTLTALRILNDTQGIAIGARHISISTCGIIPGIQRFTHEPEQFTLAVSLHAAVQDTRNILMPKVSKYSLPSLKTALIAYVEETNRRVTLEYIMIRGTNDSMTDLQSLSSFCKDLLCHVNLIPINAIPESPYQPSSTHTIHEWIQMLEQSGVSTTLRDSRGSDIDGACGQLKNTFNLK